MSRKIFSSCIVVLILVLIISLLIPVFSSSKKSSTSNSGNSNSSTTTTAINFSTLSYCAFGDSITYGADYSKSYAQMDSPYPTVVAETLGLKSYKNKGYSGATLTAQDLGLGNITEIVTSTTESYDIISLMGGVNDYNRDLPLGTSSDTTNDTVYGSLDMIASYLTTNYPDAFIFFMTPYKEIYHGVSCLTDNDEGYNLRDVANAVKLVAAKYNIPVLDMFNEGQFDLVEMTASDSDGLHPSQEFVINYTAPQIVEFIKENIT